MFVIFVNLWGKDFRYPDLQKAGCNEEIRLMAAAFPKFRSLTKAHTFSYDNRI